MDDYVSGLLEYPNVDIIETEYDSIAHKRRKIGEFCREAGVEKFLMWDDDVQIKVRDNPESLEIRFAEADEIREMIHHFNVLLDDYSHMSISRQFMNQTTGVGPPPLVKDAQRTMFLLGYRTEDYLAVDHHLDDGVTQNEDMIVNVEMLLNGMRTGVACYYVAYSKNKWNADGGCSNQRTEQNHMEEAVKMHSRYPKFVKMAHQKWEKTGNQKVEMHFEWKRIREEGLRRKGLL